MKWRHDYVTDHYNLICMNSQHAVIAYVLSLRKAYRKSSPSLQVCAADYFVCECVQEKEKKSVLTCVHYFITFSKLAIESLKMFMSFFHSANRSGVNNAVAVETEDFPLAVWRVRSSPTLPSSHPQTLICVCVCACAGVKGRYHPLHLSEL